MNCRIKIFIKGKPVLQGKYYELNGKPVFLCNVDSHKLWYKYNGYSIANQILESFQKLKLRPLILYKNIENGLVFQATPSDFYKHGIPVNFGDHRQLILPVKNWKFFKGNLEEPFNLPALTLDKWMKKPDADVRNFSIQPNIFEQLRQRNPQLVASLSS